LLDQRSALPGVFVLMPFLCAVSAVRVGAVLGLYVDIVAIHQRNLIMHQQVACVVGIGFFCCEIEVVLKDDGVLV
jgi:hypothetical protein